ncbi:hypothetical protein Salat_2684700 [Sesamum alatum]|uniref:Uncharacterized protein n=1 Tax=Sesamum alatum TaxID=300844 RepID=A0AAE2CB71_9LAMI|nr:hypothetical protein Salat_2684700 [Sesamum alatum]
MGSQRVRRRLRQAHVGDRGTTIPWIAPRVIGTKGLQTGGKERGNPLWLERQLLWVLLARIRADSSGEGIGDSTPLMGMFDALAPNPQMKQYHRKGDDVGIEFGHEGSPQGLASMSETALVSIPFHFCATARG